MDKEIKYIDEIIEVRKFTRAEKDWALSDQIRNHLDTKLVFVFDVKGSDGQPFQEVHFLYDDYFDKVLEYKEKYTDENGEAKERMVSETRMERAGRIHNIALKTKREFVEWNIQAEIRANKLFDAWLYSTQPKTK